MALSNIMREPRREITESVVGFIAFVGYIFVDYLVSQAMDPYYVTTRYSPPWGLTIVFVMLFVGIISPIVIFAAFYLTHAIGEMVCGWMKAANVDPRPRQRY